MVNPYEQGGVTGNKNQQALIQAMQGQQAPQMQAPVDAPITQPPMADAPAAPPQQYKLEGFDAGKMADAGHTSPKYQIGRALQGFDPRQGVTTDVLAKLNGLGIGQFSGQGDKVNIANGDPRFEGVNMIDLVRGFHDPNSDGGWQFGAENTNAPQQQAGGMRPQTPGIPSVLQSDPSTQIQQMLAQYSEKSPNLQALLAQMAQTGGA